ncbi:hypothetical protein FM105_03395 [Brevibacterium yomogidense]|uniref:Uncharacterized protein n=1 Tax=Brevibacterium yomogidense TaxID=946573 RepID=A0A1X6X2M9_9MICO|nr:hypothetical protein FM105_03395 [Brevibacterium yomogidense]
MLGDDAAEADSADRRTLFPEVVEQLCDVMGDLIAHPPPAPDWSGLADAPSIENDYSVVPRESLDLS